VNILLNEKQELRSGWKFAVYIALFLILWIASAVAISMVYARSNIPEGQLTFLALNEFTLFVAAVGAMLLAVRFVDRRPLSAFGVGFLPYWRRDLGAGLIIAGGMLTVLMAGCYAFGYVSIRWTGRQVPASTLFATFSILLLAAVAEELVFRGFPLQILVDGVGQWPAVLAMSVIFGAMHLSNPNASVLGSVNTVIAGILLSLAYVRTRSLWLPYGIHVGWNVGLGFLLGFPLSGLDLASLWTTGIAGSDTILGGGYGPEGGLLATFIFASSAVIVSSSTSIRPSTRAYRGAGERQSEE
jgi:membrane protease YdiL (CAAX protease family)